MGAVSRRNVQLVILCEGQQDEVFIRRFLERRGWSTRRLRVERRSVPGSGEQFVRERYPVELQSYRAKRGQVRQALVVMMDGDRWGVRERLAQLNASCREAGIQPRNDGEHVAVFIPTWRIETWFAYLEGHTVNEEFRGYPKLRRKRECQIHVEALDDMCERGNLRHPVPPSLQAACDEFRSRVP